MKPTFIINKFYNEYADIEIDFHNKSVSNITGLVSNRVYLKVKGEQWNCTLYSCSMKCAKILINMDTEAFQNLQNAKNIVHLNLAFQKEQDKDPITFFIPSVIEGYKNFNDKLKETFIFNLNFMQKPSDELIDIISDIIEENEKSEKRKNTRININKKILEGLGLKSQNIIVEIDKIKRPSVLKNISATGVSILLSCIAKFIMNKQIILYLVSTSMQTIIKVSGTIVWNNKIEGRKDIYELGIELDFDKIPLEFKHMINIFLDKIEILLKQK